MSRVAIKGNASGTATYTLEAPAGSTDRTLTLPDEAGTVLTSGTDVANFPSGFANGITHFDQWRITVNKNLSAGSVGNLDANWERVDTDNPGFLGTAMTESSGVFTFPTTGIWLVNFLATFELNGNDRQIETYVYFSNDGGSTVELVSVGNAFIQQTNSQNTYSMASNLQSFDITNTSNQVVQFRVFSRDGSTDVRGGTNETRTNVAFTRLGDT
jgi:hypothetical protein